MYLTLYFSPMKKTLRVLVTLSFLASSMLFAQPASAIGVLYSLGTNDNNGDVPCSVSGWITIQDNVVRESSNCVGAANIPFGPHTIGYMSLTGNAITSVTISDSVTHIRDEAFIRSNSIQSVTFGNSVQYIGGGAFAEMSALTSLTLPESLRNIDGGAFSRMNPAITSITIPNGIVGVGAWSFNDVNFTSYRYCGNNLSSWTLYRADLYRIPNTCLSGIGSLYSSSIGSGDVACTTGFFTVLNNVVTRSTECSGVVNVPSGVTSIADGAFGGRAITSVTIPNSVLSIGGVAFGATGLTSLSIGNGLEYIGGEAFLWTDALSSYSYCGTLLSQEILDQRLSGKTKTCVPSTAPVTAGTIANSQVATFSNGITEAVIPATAELPAVKLNFGGTAPQAVTLVPMTENPAPLTATPFKVTGSTKIVDIQISGTFNGVATVCLDGASTDSVFHYTGGQWVELANRTYSNGQICGDTTSFSPFTAAPANANPSAPGSVVATATGKRAATVSFTAPNDNGGATITSYTLVSTPGSIIKTLTQSVSGAFNVTGLQPGTSYTFSVTATNSIGTSAGVTSNAITTTVADVASLTSVTFTDDGTGTGGKVAWSGKNIDAVLYTGPAASYPGPFTFGAFSTSWNGSIRNLTPATEYTISIYAISVDGIGESKSLTFKTGAKSIQIIDLAYWATWLNNNTFSSNESASLLGLLNKFDALVTSPHRSFIKVPTSRVSKVEVTSLTPNSCSVVSATAKVDAGLVKALTNEKCTISYTVSGPSKAPATLVKDFVFKKVAN
jgi:hypothetical protein